MNSRLEQIKEEQLHLVSIAAGKGTELIKKSTKPALFMKTTIIRIKPLEICFEEELQEKEATILKIEATQPKSCCTIM